MFPQTPGPIGLFDSGYGGLTIFDKIHQLMPGYDYVYLGDNARSPYGTRSFEVVYQFTRQAVSRLFESGCQLVILACKYGIGESASYDSTKRLAYMGSQSSCIGSHPSYS